MHRGKSDLFKVVFLLHLNLFLITMGKAVTLMDTVFMQKLCHQSQ